GCAAVLRSLRSLAALIKPARGDGGVGAFGMVAGGGGEMIMLRIYPVILETLEQLRGPIAQIARRDSDLNRQLRRCGASIALNVAEGMYARGKSRDARYHTALGSAREALSCLEVAQALGYVGGLDRELLGKLNQIIGTLVRLVGS